MSDQDNNASGVRRVGSKDRKPKLTSGGLQFPPSEHDEPLASPVDADDRFPPLPPEPRPKPIVNPTPLDPTTGEPSLLDDRYPALPPLPPEYDPLPFDDFDDSPSIYTPVDERFPPLPPDFTEAGEIIEQPEPEPVMPEPEFLPQTAGRPARRRSGGGGLQNFIAILFILASIAVLVIGFMIFRDPYTEINPFPPPTPLPIFITATFSAPQSGIGPTASFTPLPVEWLTQMAPNGAVAGQTAVPAPTEPPTLAAPEAVESQPTVDFINATAVAPPQ